MRIGLKMSAAMVLALVAATLTSVAPPAGAAPGADWDAAFKGTDVRSGKVAVNQPLVMPGGTRNGIQTNIVCDVIGLGPSLVGGYVNFSINISCSGGVPQYLEVRQNIARHIAPGNFVIEPGSYAQCPGPNTPVLVCSSIATCFRAGANYDGYAVLMGVDEFGVTHWATYYKPPTWVGCII